MKRARESGAESREDERGAVVVWGARSRARVFHGRLSGRARPQTRRPTVRDADLDETLVLFNSLIDGSFVPPGTHDVKATASVRNRLAASWVELITRVADAHFFFAELETCEEAHAGDLSAHDDGSCLVRVNAAPRRASRRAALRGRCASPPELSRRLHGRRAPPTQSEAELAAGAASGALPTQSSDGAPSQPLDARAVAVRLRLARERYARGAEALLGPDEVDAWRALYDETDAFAASWLRDGVAAVAAVGKRNTNVLVTSGCLLPTLSKLLVFRLAPLFAVDEVYSSRRDGKAAVFSRIREHFGAARQYIAVGDGAEEADAAAALGWPCVRVAMLQRDDADGEDSICRVTRSLAQLGVDVDNAEVVSRPST